MTFESFKEACFKAALEKGCEAAEVFFREDESFSVNVLNSEISKYTLTDSICVSFSAAKRVMPTPKFSTTPMLLLKVQSTMPVLLKTMTKTPCRANASIRQ